ncbi:MAG: DUF1080 domain-containing protein [bacterium]
MRSLIRLAVFQLLLAPLCLSISADKAALSQEEKADNFELLFNGEDLDGWIVQGYEGMTPAIEDGVMLMSRWDWWAVISKKKFKNFILRCDVRIEPKGNTGILFHTPEKKVFTTSPEIQFRDDAGSKPSEKCSGAIFNNLAPTKNAIKPAGEWNAVEITVKDDRLTVILNGEKVQDNIDLKSLTLKGDDGVIRKRQEGGIALQHKGEKKNHTSAFRNIRIKSL